MTTLKQLNSTIKETIARWEQTAKRHEKEMNELSSDLNELDFLLKKIQIKLSKKIYERLQDLMPDAEIDIEHEDDYDDYKYNGKIKITLKEENMEQLYKLCIPKLDSNVKIRDLEIDYDYMGGRILVIYQSTAYTYFPIEDEIIKKLLLKIAKIHSRRVKCKDYV